MSGMQLHTKKRIRYRESFSVNKQLIQRKNSSSCCVIVMSVFGVLFHLIKVIENCVEMTFEASYLE